MRVLVVNAGSSSLNLRLLDADDTVLFAEDLTAHHGHFDMGTAGEAIRRQADRIDAVGHRIVHGGATLIEPVILDEVVERKLRQLTALAPLHQPTSLAGIDLVWEVLRDTPSVVCFQHGVPRQHAGGGDDLCRPRGEWRNSGSGDSDSTGSATPMPAVEPPTWLVATWTTSGS